MIKRDVWAGTSLVIFASSIGIKKKFFHRFDLIFLILDPQDEVFDRRLAGHLVSLYFRGEADEEEENLVNILLVY